MENWTEKDRLLYRAISELDMVQCVENCHSGLCKSSEGRSIVEDGMKLLGISDLAGDGPTGKIEDCAKEEVKS